MCDQPRRSAQAVAMRVAMAQASRCPWHLLARRYYLARAEAKITRVAELIEARPCGAVGGKLETYIRRHAPDALAALVDAGIMKP